MLERAGKASEAQKIVRDALSQSSKGAAADESALAKALRELQAAFTGAATDGKSFGNMLGTFINDQIAEMKANGDTTSVAFKQASADAAGLTQKEQDLLTAERNRLDPQAQYLRGMRDQVAANAGLTEGD